MLFRNHNIKYICSIWVCMTFKHLLFCLFFSSECLDILAYKLLSLLRPTCSPVSLLLISEPKMTLDERYYITSCFGHQHSVYKTLYLKHTNYLGTYNTNSKLFEIWGCGNNRNKNKIWWFANPLQPTLIRHNIRITSLILYPTFCCQNIPDPSRHNNTSTFMTKCSLAAWYIPPTNSVHDEEMISCIHSPLSVHNVMPDQCIFKYIWYKDKIFTIQTDKFYLLFFFFSKYI